MGRAVVQKEEAVSKLVLVWKGKRGLGLGQAGEHPEQGPVGTSLGPEQPWLS